MNKKKKSIILVVGVVFIIVIIFEIVWYFFLGGKKMMDFEKDLQIVKNFDSIQSKIIEYYQTNKKLPEKLELVSGLPAVYEYIVQDKTLFKLCADFISDVTDEIVAKAPIRVDYKQGHDCVTFNIGSAVGEAQNNMAVKRDVILLPIVATISVNPEAGVKAGSITIDIDPSKSKMFKNETDGGYLVNFYSTIGTDKECKSTVNPENGCCYTLNDVSLTSATGKNAIFNRLGSDTYIDPSPAGLDNTFGDLPVSFCFNGGMSFSGGMSFVVPEGILNQSTSNLLSFKHKNNGENSESIEITIKF